MNRPSAQLGAVVTAMGLVAFAVAVLVLGVVHFSGRAVDRLALETQTMLVERALAREYRQLEADIQSAAIWTEAYEAVANRDADWLLENFGDYYARYLDHDLTLVFDTGDEPVFAFAGGLAVDPAEFREVSKDLAPVLSDVRARDSAVRADPRRLMISSFDQALASHAAIHIDGAIHFVAASTVLADEPGLEDPQRPHAIVVSGRKADMLLDSLSVDLSVQDPELVTDRMSGPGVLIAGAGGDPAGLIVWRFARPGADVQLQVMSALVAGGLILIAASVVLLLRVRAILKDLRTNSEALAASLDELTVARDAAQAASRAKSRFLASMSHEIRTPLNGVLGLAQSLMLDDLKPEHRDKVSLILASGQNLTAVLNDVLDISRIEAGKLDLSPTDSRPLTVLRQATQLFHASAEEKGLELVFEPGPGLDRTVRIDALRLHQCVANLLSNAIKFTPSGSVMLTASISEPSADGCIISIEVADTGIGMSAQTLSRLFDNFVQADASTTRTYGGSGLGLAISRRLARLMGGDIEVRSEPGQGTVFTLTVRAEPAREPAGSAEDVGRARPDADAGEWMPGVRILIVDDNALNRRVVRLFLAGSGAVCAEAANGQEALVRLASGPFDLVLLDVHMPVMDGRACIRAIRNSPEPWSGIPVIALTAEAMAGDRESLLACGMSEYVAKPVDRADLLAKAARCLGMRGAFPQAGEGAHGPSLSGDDLSSVLDAIGTAVA